MNAGRRVRAALIGAMLFPAGLFAHLGDTVDEAEHRYGAGHEHDAQAPATSARTYMAGAVTIEAEFIDGRVRRISYQQAAEFTADDTARRLAENADGRQWTPQQPGLNPVADHAGSPSWNRSDRGFAVLRKNPDGSHTLAITDAVFLLARLRAAAAAPAVPLPAAPVAVTPPPPAAAAAPARGSLTGKILLAFGALVSVLAWWHDSGRLRISREIPQGAPSRIAPEVHALGAIFTAIGAGLQWGWAQGVAWAVLQLVLAYVVVPPLLYWLWRRRG